MNKPLIASMFAVAVGAAVAMPSINPESVKVTQASTRKVTIEYELRDEKAIVTVDIQTNAVGGAESGWTSIGDEHLSHMYGDVNRLVSKLEGKSYAYWQPNKSWPNGGLIENARAVVTAWATNCPPDYMVIDLHTKDVTFYTSSNAVPGGVTDSKYRTTSLVMRKIPAAGVIWNMGSPAGEGGSASYEQLHPVVISYDYYVGVYECTIGQWKAAGQTVPSQCPWAAATDGDMRPVTNFDFRRVRHGNPTYYTFYRKGRDLPSDSAMQSLRNAYGIKFDIPTSAEWEFACRAGEAAAFNNGLSSIGDAGWCTANATERDAQGRLMPQVVGTQKPNAWGIYDMHGNVHEWICEYCGQVSKVWKEGDDPVVDQAIPDDTGDYLMVRGGSVNSAESDCRSATCRNGAQVFNPDPVYNGFRFWAPAVIAR